MDDFVSSSGILVLGSHSMDLLREWCNRAILLEQGRITAAGGVAEVTSLYESARRTHENRHRRPSAAYRRQCGEALRLIRASVRWLQTVPVIGPLVARAKPYARALVDHWHDLRDDPWHQNRWNDAAPFRPLLSEAPTHLGLRRRLQRRLLIIFLALPDGNYRRALVSFDRKIAAVRAARAAGPARAGILMVIGTLDPGGAERQLVMTLEELQARGHGPLGLACTYLTTQDQRFFLPEVEAAGIPVTTIGVAPIEAIDRTVVIAIKALPVNMASVIDYAAVFAAKRPAIAHLWMDEVNTLAGIAAVATGVPRVILGQHSGPPHHFVFHHPYMREAYRWLARQPGVTLVNCSDSGARAYERWIGLPHGTIRSIHNGFKFDDSVLNCYRADRGHYRARFGIPADAPLIGTVFRMSEEKRPLLWLEIAALVRRVMPQTRFLVVGSGPLREQIELRAAANDLAGAVHFAGYERNVFAAIADMDLFLLCSRIEGLPNVLIEAQTLGVPVVTTKAGGAAETLVDGVTGIVLKDIDPMTAAAVIVELLQDEDRLLDMRRRAPAFVASTFNIERTVNEILKVYAGVGHGITGMQ